MIISILNCDKEYGIGKKNGLLFSLKEDMAFFRKTTLNHVVAMGENTLLSFPNQKPLKNRTNIVLSADKSHNYEGVVNVHSFEEFLTQGSGLLPPAGAGHSPSRRQREPGAPVDTVRRGAGPLRRQPCVLHPGVRTGFPGRWGKQ